MPCACVYGTSLLAGRVGVRVATLCGCSNVRGGGAVTGRTWAGGSGASTQCHPQDKQTYLLVVACRPNLHLGHHRGGPRPVLARQLQQPAQRGQPPWLLRQQQRAGNAGGKQRRLHRQFDSGSGRRGRWGEGGRQRGWAGLHSSGQRGRQQRRRLRLPGARRAGARTDSCWPAGPKLQILLLQLQHHRKGRATADGGGAAQPPASEARASNGRHPAALLCSGRGKGEQRAPPPRQRGQPHRLRRRQPTAPVPPLVLSARHGMCVQTAAGCHRRAAGQRLLRRKNWPICGRPIGAAAGRRQQLGLRWRRTRLQHGSGCALGSTQPGRRHMGCLPAGACPDDWMMRLLERAGL